ncbi:MFS transporter [Candidatus Rhodobacter oscarellae]|nr:MFS transporter [Candidatus Rhodobacter lobularis]
MFATIAFSVDSMLPMMGEIAAELTPSDPNRAQLMIISFVFGMGIGTLFSGPMADAIGRKRTIIGGAVIYSLAAAWAYFAQSIEAILVARFIQGLGSAGPRIAALALVRDLYSGRDMARILSLAMMVFTMVPAVAPLIGSFIAAGFGWRGIFVAFVIFAAMMSLWLGARQPETLRVEDRRPLRVSVIWGGIKEVFDHRRVVVVLLTMSLSYYMIFFIISTVQQVFDATFDRAASFPWWFALMSVISASGALLNSRVVPVLGMRRVTLAANGAQIGFSAVMLLVILSGVLSELAYFYAYWIWVLTVFMVGGGLSLGNLNALGVEPLGHMAGLANSIIAAVGTVIAGVLATLAGMFFDGTPWVQVLTVCMAATGAVLLMRSIED